MVSKNSLTSSKMQLRSLKEQQIEQVRMHDLVLVLGNLFQRESATAKTVLDCLYDIASIHLINQKVPCRHLNRLMKHVARMSKPVFRIFALRWFQRNGPQLVANLLHSEVISRTSNESPKNVVTVTTPVENAPAQLPATQSTAEVQHLRTQVSRLTGIAIAATAALTGTILFVGYRLETNPVQLFLSHESIPLQSLNQRD